MRIHGPFRHGRRWRLHLVGDDQRVRRLSFASKEDAAAELDHLLAAELLDTAVGALVATAVDVPAAPVWVYLLRDRDRRVVYVGIASSPSSRLKAHRGKSFAAVSVIPQPFDKPTALRVEAALIRLLQPPLNRTKRGTGIANSVATPI